MSIISIPKKLEEWQKLPEARDMSDDMLILYLATKAIKPTEILELGTGGGLSTRAFALAASELSSGSTPVKVISVDIDSVKSNAVSKIINDEGFSNVSFTIEDSIEFLKRNCQHSIDLIFIDTDHTYKQTLAEIMIAITMITSKGYIFLHDTRYPAVWDAIQTFLRTNTGFTFMDYATPAGIGLIMRKNTYWFPIMQTEAPQ